MNKTMISSQELKIAIEKNKDPQGYVLKRLMELEDELQKKLVEIKSESGTLVSEKLKEIVSEFEAEKEVLLSELRDTIDSTTESVDSLVLEAKNKLAEIDNEYQKRKRDVLTYKVTENDKKEIAKMIPPLPPIEKVIEKRTEIIREKPIEIVKKEIINQVIEKAVTDEPTVIAKKLNTTEESVDMSVIKGLKTQIDNLKRALREKKSGGVSRGGGMGNAITQTTALTSGATTITLDFNVASNGKAIWFNYQGQQQAYGTHFTVSGKTINLLFTPDDSTFADIIYIRK